MGDIFIDFPKAQAQADEVESLGMEIKQLAEVEFAETMQELALMWEGECAGQYLTKGALLQQVISKAAKDVLKIAHNIRYTANKMHEAEEQAAAIARNTSSEHG